MSSRKMCVCLFMVLTILWGLSSGYVLAQSSSAATSQNAQINTGTNTTTVTVPDGPPPGPPPGANPQPNPMPHPMPTYIAPSIEMNMPPIPPGPNVGPWPGMQGVGISTNSGTNWSWNWSMKPDPETQALREKEGKLEGDVQKIVNDYNSTKDKDERAKLKKKLEDVSGEQFEIRQQYRELEVKRLEKELARIRDSIQKRNENRQQIIQRRISQLIHEEDDLQF
jgi:hypothetical protein